MSTTRDHDRKLSGFERQIDDADDEEFEPIFILAWGSKHSIEEQERAFLACVKEARKAGYSAGKLLVSLPASNQPE